MLEHIDVHVERFSIGMPTSVIPCFACVLDIFNVPLILFSVNVLPFFSAPLIVPEVIFAFSINSFSSLSGEDMRPVSVLITHDEEGVIILRKTPFSIDSIMKSLRCFSVSFA